jgi:hypothetical protein
LHRAGHHSTDLVHALTETWETKGLGKSCVASH